MKKEKKRNLKEVLEAMIKSTSGDLEYPAYGNYAPSKKVFLLALKVAILEGRITP